MDNQQKNYLLQMLTDYILLNELLAGPHAQICLHKMGIKNGMRAEDQFRAQKGYGEKLTVKQFADLAVDYILVLGGSYRTRIANEQMVEFAVNECPFGHMTLKAPGLCDILTGALGGIAARNFSYCKVSRQSTLLTNDGPCTITVYLQKTDRSQAVKGHEFLNESASDVFLPSQVKVIKEKILASNTKYESCFEGFEILKDTYQSLEYQYEKLRNEMFTEQAQMEKYSLLAQLAAGTAHEIRNPMTTLRGFLQVLSKEFKPRSKGLEYCLLMIEEIDRANAMINEFLLLTKPATPKRRQIELHMLLEEIFLLIESKSLLENVKLRKKYTKGLLPIHVDSDQIKQVFLNLATNAIQAMPDGGELTISTSAQKEMVVIHFEDTGHGMDIEQIDKIFEPYFTTKEQGTGLGLTISNKIIDQHNGRLYAESEIGKGSTFTIELPAFQGWDVDNAESVL